MNREIKFRAFHEGKMIHDAVIMPIDNQPACFVTFITHGIFGLSIKYGLEIKRFPDTPFFQYIEKNDSYGFEIYRDDILKVGQEIHVVSWIKENTGWYPFASMIQSTRDEIEKFGVEKIGTVSENPELLTKTA